jgi:hypothetical protein
VQNVIPSEGKGDEGPKIDNSFSFWAGIGSLRR